MKEKKQEVSNNDLEKNAECNNQNGKEKQDIHNISRNDNTMIDNNELESSLNVNDSGNKIFKSQISTGM